MNHDVIPDVIHGVICDVIHAVIHHVVYDVAMILFGVLPLCTCRLWVRWHMVAQHVLDIWLVGTLLPNIPGTWLPNTSTRHMVAQLFWLLVVNGAHCVYSDLYLRTSFLGCDILCDIYYLYVIVTHPVVTRYHVLHIIHLWNGSARLSICFYMSATLPTTFYYWDLQSYAHISIVLSTAAVIC